MCLASSTDMRQKIHAVRQLRIVWERYKMTIGYDEYSRSTEEMI